MSNVLGIIAEYNPFHNGHLYHLNKSKEITKSDYTIAVIGGNFTQRGSTSIVDKWSKAEMAISNGIDLVIELPVLYSISSAENFAEGGIKILDSLNIVNYLSFGTETTDINCLNQIAEVLYNEPIEYKNILSHELNKGLSFPKARENALMFYLNDIRKFANVLSSPNNILGIEYLKTLNKLKSTIKPVSISRYESNYNSINFKNGIASATAIRNIITNKDFKILKSLIPNSSYEILSNKMKCGNLIPDIYFFEKQIFYNLRKMTIQEIANLPDVSEGLEYAIKNASNNCNSIIEFLNIMKSKRYTSTRLSRILLYSLINITKKDMELSKKINPYIRILGFNEKGQILLSEIVKRNPKLKVITSVKKFIDFNYNKNLKRMLDIDIFSTNIYTLGYEYNSKNNLDFTNKIIKL